MTMHYCYGLVPSQVLARKHSNQSQACIRRRREITRRTPPTQTLYKCTMCMHNVQQAPYIRFHLSAAMPHIHPPAALCTVTHDHPPQPPL